MDFKLKKINKKEGKSQRIRGFTLMEMIVVLAIFSILTAVVVFNYNRFTSQTILTNMAYEMALSIREAQLFGTAVRGVSGAGFQDHVGVKFDIDSGPTNLYLLYRDNDGNGWSIDETVQTFSLQRGTTITKLELCNGSWTEEEPKNTLEIVFERPNPEPKFYSSGSSGSERLKNAQIEITSPQDQKVYVLINGVGQISVSGTELCNN